MSASGLTAVKATIVEVTSEIKGLEERIERLEEKIERLEQSYPANERPTELAVELGQLRTMENTLQEELVELLRQRNILLTREVAAQVQVAPEAAAQVQAAAEPACNLLNWGYKSVAIDSTTRIGHKRLYHGNCELVQLPFELFCPIVNAKMRDVTSNVILPAGVAKRMRDFAADVEADLEGRAYPLTSEAQLNARFRALVGKGVAEVVNACILQKQPTWSRLAFTAEARPSNLFCWPDFLIKQNGVDVCGGVGQMPDAMDYAVDLVTRPCVAVDDALMQACSYCQEKKWRFTFITYYQLTFFVWRVAEDKYAVTDGFLHDGAPYGLHTREALAYIMWMSLEAPWGKQLSEQDNGALQALEKQLKQQVAVKVLRGKPMEDNKDPSELSKLQHSRSLASGGERRNQTTGTAYYAAHQKDQPPSWTPIRDAPEYPLAALQLGGKNLGAGQCGPVMQGWFGEVPVAIKGTDACKRPDIVKMLWHEAQIYGTLKELQGHILPVLHGCGYWWGRNSFFLATSVVAGEPLNYCIDEAVSEAVAEAARQALTAIHQRGVAHGDVRYDNFLVQYHDDKAQVYIIDFGHAYLNPTPEECEDEMAELERVLLNGLGVPE